MFAKLLDNPESILYRKYRRQLLAALSINIITLSHGIGLGWVSPTLTKLTSDNSPLDFEVGLTETSWIGSALGLGSLFGNLFCGFLLSRIGHKACLYMIAIPHICLWVLIYTATSVEYLYVARFLGGAAGGGCYVVMPIFVSEIADVNIRGTLATILMQCVTFGILLGFIVATHLSYYLVPCVIIVLPILYLLACWHFPNTAQYLLRRGRISEAWDAFKYYKNYPKDQLEKCEEEFEQLKANIIKGPGKEPVTCSDFVSKAALMSFLTASVMLIVNQFSGFFAFINYMSNIFAISGSIFDVDTCTIIVGVAQIIGANLASIIVDRSGRKILMLISTAGVSISLVIFGCFTYYAESHSVDSLTWVPLLLMVTAVLSANMGIVALTFVLTVEIFPKKIRAFGASASMSVLSFLVFVSLKVFPIYMDTFGISVTMWSCAGVSAFACIYLAIFLEETRGKSMDVD